MEENMIDIIKNACKVTVEVARKEDAGWSQGEIVKYLCKIFPGQQEVISAEVERLWTSTFKLTITFTAGMELDEIEISNEELETYLDCLGVYAAVTSYDIKEILS